MTLALNGLLLLRTASYMQLLGSCVSEAKSAPLAVSHFCAILISRTLVLTLTMQDIYAIVGHLWELPRPFRELESEMTCKSNRDRP